MGKDLSGNNCGKGICQRKDGLYTARYINGTGKRVERYFSELKAAQIWIENARSSDKASHIKMSSKMTVEEWYHLWMQMIAPGRAHNTIRNYKERFQRNILPLIGALPLEDVRPIHCKIVLNECEKIYAGGTVAQVYIVMGTCFKAAVNNRLIEQHPMDGVRYTKPKKTKCCVKYFTRDEEERFLLSAKADRYYAQYALILETGLRTGELVGLTWDDIDFERHTLMVRKTLHYRYDIREWQAGPPKTENSYRKIYLTPSAIEIFEGVRNKSIPEGCDENIPQHFTYTDLQTGRDAHFSLADLVFKNARTGLPVKNSAYDSHLYALCDRAGVKRIGMHGLRHTFATRAIERGVPPKALQVLLGHKNINTTMDTYVHASDEYLKSAIDLFAAEKEKEK